MSNMHQMSQIQLQKFKTAIGFDSAGGNFRPPQALDGRTITGCASSAIHGGHSQWYPYDAASWGTTVTGHSPTCTSGQKQSPINFPRCDEMMVQSPISITWNDQQVKLVNNGHTIQLEVTNMAASGKMVVDGVSYSLAQCRFHWGSEHKVAGGQMPMEVACVHGKDSYTNAYGVLGVFLEIATISNPFLAQFENSLPGVPEHTAETVSSYDGGVVGVNFKMLYGNDDLTQYWQYQGSLTTPPCTEAHDYFILSRRQPMTQMQLNKFKTAIGWISAGGNFRTPQALRARIIVGCGDGETITAQVADAAWSLRTGFKVLGLVLPMLLIV